MAENNIGREIGRALIEMSEHLIEKSTREQRQGWITAIAKAAFDEDETKAIQFLNTQNKTGMSFLNHARESVDGFGQVRALLELTRAP